MIKEGVKEAVHGLTTKAKSGADPKRCIFVLVYTTCILHVCTCAYRYCLHGSVSVGLSVQLPHGITNYDTQTTTGRVNTGRHQKSPAPTAVLGRHGSMAEPRPECEQSGPPACWEDNSCIDPSSTAHTGLSHRQSSRQEITLNVLTAELRFMWSFKSMWSLSHKKKKKKKINVGIREIINQCGHWRVIMWSLRES